MKRQEIYMQKIVYTDVKQSELFEAINELSDAVDDTVEVEYQEANGTYWLCGERFYNNTGWEEHHIGESK